MCEAGEAAPRRHLELSSAQTCRYDNYAYTLLDAMVRLGVLGVLGVRGVLGLLG